MPNDPSVPSLSSDKRGAIDAFLEKVRAPATVSPGARGRLIFALDATASRQPIWDSACQLQADMFRETAAIGGLDVQLVYYRGRDECRASQWVSQPERLAGLMERIDCRTGFTQIGKVLAHAKRETQSLKVQALVFVGMRWKRSSTICAMPRVSLVCPPSRSRRVTIRPPSRRFARSRA
jgi:hypothetical protein